MLRGIARAGVAAGQLMTKRGSLMTRSSSPLSESQNVMSESSLSSVLSFASPLVYYRYSEKPCDLPAFLMNLGNNASNASRINTSPSAPTLSLVTDVTESSPDALYLLSRNTILPNELVNPLPIPVPYLGLVMRNPIEDSTPSSPSSPSTSNSPGRNEKTSLSLLTSGQGRSPERQSSGLFSSGAAAIKSVDNTFETIEKEDDSF
jgi:hypothetical protein